MDNLYASFNSNVARLINREESYTLFVPHTPEIIRISKKLFDALRLCTGEYSFPNIVKQAAISDELKTINAFNEFEKKGIVSFHQSPQKPRCPIEITSASKMRCRTAIYHITLKCNLTCQHCYASSSPYVDDAQELSSNESSKFIRDFAKASGLFIDFTGGEALLRDDTFDQLALARSVGLRVGLLSNGKLITPKNAERLKSSVHEVTISIDGSKDTHDKIRGDGAYNKAIEAIRNLVELGIDTAVTTLMTDRSFPVLDDILELLLRNGVKQWNLSVPRESGRAKQEEGYLFDNAINCLRSNDGNIESVLARLHEKASNSRLKIVLDESLLCTKLRERIVKSLGVEYEADSRCCWDNVITVLPNGDCVACVFFKNLSYGNVRDMGFPEVLINSKCLDLKSYFHMTFKPGICPHLAISSCSRTGDVFPKPINSFTLK